MKITTKKRLKLFGLTGYIKLKLLKALGFKDITLKIGHQKIFFRLIKSDLDTLVEAFDGEYSILEDKLDKDFNGLIVDAGGHIGAAAIQLSVMYPKAKILSIEPDIKNFFYLKHNTFGFENIQCICAALSGDITKRLMPLVDRGTGPWGYSIAANPYNDSLIRGYVPVISINDVLVGFPGLQLGILKCDIEGGELSLLSHESESLNQFPFLVFELHERIVPGVKIKFESAFSGREILPAGHEKYFVGASK